MIAFGTGASEKDGVKEAVCMKNLLLHRFDDLQEFSLINSHKCFQKMEDREALYKFFENIHCEVASKNTAEEINNTSLLFLEYGCREIYQITCGSHLSRCIRKMEKIRETGILPEGQRWYGIADDMRCDGTHIGEANMPNFDFDLEGQEHSGIPGILRLTAQQNIDRLRGIYEMADRTSSSST